MKSLVGKKRSIEDSEEVISEQLLDLSQRKPASPELDQQAPPAVDDQNLLPLQSNYGNAAVARTLIQRKAEGEDLSGAPGATSETAATPSQTPAAAVPATTPRALIVDDKTETIEPGQMRKSEFLAQMRAAVSNTLAESLAGIPLSTVATPYVDQAFAHYTAQDCAQLERSIRRHASEAAAVTSAAALIPIVAGRVRRSVATWIKTGEVPEGSPLGLPVAGGGDAGSSVIGAAGGVASAIGNGISSVGSLLFKGQDGGAKSDNDPQAVQSQLGSGQSLDARVRARMESAFGESFAGVQVHADAKGAELSQDLGARAFTVGQHIAFGTGEYQPGTLIGDALIAHELAHVTQQRGGAASGPERKGTGDQGQLENAADHSAVSAIVSTWLGQGTGLAKIGTNVMPRMKSVLRLQRCNGNKPAPQKPQVPDPKLLTDFAEKFPEAADLIRKSGSALRLVLEAEAAGASFAGYSEEGPAKDAWPYHISGKVYIPKAFTDKVVAMSKFLFELNNALRAPKHKELNIEAAKGSTGTLSAKEFARKKVEQEVEGMLRLGEVWFETKKEFGSGKKWDKYDVDFYLDEFKDFKAGKKTKDDIINEVLKRVYPSGVDAGKTVEQYYIEQYNKASRGK